MLKGLSKKKAHESAKYWLEKIELADYANKKLEVLSKGNQQKIQLAVSLISDPDIVILDEPFSGLDPVNSILLKDIVREQVQKGKIVIFSSHQMHYVEEFCEEVVIIREGEVAVSGLIKDIRKNFLRDRLIISGDDNKSIVDFLNDECKGIISGVEQNNGYIEAALKNPDNKKKLMQLLLSADFEIDQIKVKEPTLNDIFIKYTGDTA